MDKALIDEEIMNVFNKIINDVTSNKFRNMLKCKFNLYFF